MPSQDSSKSAGQPVPPPLPQANIVRHKSHEAEDCDNIPDVYHNNVCLRSNEVDDNGAILHRALHVSRNQGKNDVQVCPERAHYLSIDGRLKTFEDAGEALWTGPAGQKMARAGLYRLPNRGGRARARCAFCGMNFSFKNTNENPMEHHKKLSPNCRYLKALGDHGIHKRPLEKKRHHHSTLSLHIFTRPA